MTETIFLRLLPCDDKATALAEAVCGVRDGSEDAAAFAVDPASFQQVPGAPLAYWVSGRVRDLFRSLPRFEACGRVARRTNGTTDDFRWIRGGWETSVREAGRSNAWFPHAKGGSFSPYYADVHLVIGWDETKQTYPGYEGTIHRPDRRPASLSFFFRPGITWPRRTQRGLNFRVLPEGCIFGDKGPSVFVEGDSRLDLSNLLGLTNSQSFRLLVSLQMAFGSYEAGVIQRTPVPDLNNPDGNRLGKLALACVDLKRDLDTANEMSHVYRVPALLQAPGATLASRLEAWRVCVTEAERRLTEHQREIDDIAFRLYGIGGEDRRAIEASLGNGQQIAVVGDDGAVGDDEDDEVGAADSASVDEVRAVADLLSHLVGCALGRWDVRLATGEREAPPLPDPFAPLPVCSLGMLTGDGGLPARVPPPGYPLRFDADGILTDDPDHADDIVKRARAVLDLDFGERAEAIEREACQILGVRDLRDYFRKPGAGGFWADHIRRYSKSRRKAPIYWLLQSPKRTYALWLYYHRLDGDILYKALINYVEPKLRHEEEQLAGLKAQLGSVATPREARQVERQIERQEALLADVGEFRDRLKRAADLNLTPDLNDGVVLTIAPLHELVPWAEAKKYWQELLAGKYEWSSIGKQLRAKGLVK